MIVIAASSAEARTHLRDIAGADVALVLADRADDGPRLLAATRSLHPHAQRVLLIGWNEHRSACEEIMKVLARGDAGYYVAKPMAPPDERFHHAISEFLDDWWRLRGRPFEAVRVVGGDHSPRAHEICDLLHRHGFPYVFHDVDSDAGRAALEAAAVKPTSTAVVIVEGRAPLIDPTNVEVAKVLCADAARRRHLRRRSYRWRPRRPFHGGVRSLRRPARRVPRTHVDGRSGRHELDDPQLPRLSAGVSGAELADRASRPSDPLRDRDGLRRRRGRRARRG